MSGGGRNLQPCGTPAGARTHRRRREEVCPDCREAFRTYMAEWRAGQPKKPRELAPCGSVSAYRRHLRRGETPCSPCRNAQAAAIAAYREGVA